MVEKDWNVETTRHCLFMDDLLPMEQWHSKKRISSNELKESLLTDCDGVAFVYAVDRH